MATVDLVCTYDAANSDAWTSGTSISVNDGTTASITRNQYQLTKIGFTTDAATAIPAGATKTSVQLIIKCRSGFSTGKVYVKEPGGFPDSGSALHTVSFTSTLASYTSIDISAEKPAVLSDALTSGYLRIFHEYTFASLIYIDYISLRVTYTEGNAETPLLFMSENM